MGNQRVRQPLSHQGVRLLRLQWSGRATWRRCQSSKELGEKHRSQREQHLQRPWGYRVGTFEEGPLGHREHEGPKRDWQCPELRAHSEQRGGGVLGRPQGNDSSFSPPGLPAAFPEPQG